MDQMSLFAQTAMRGLEILGTIVLFLLAIVLIGSVILFVIDRTQTKDAIRYNYPSSGAFARYFLH